MRLLSKTFLIDQREQIFSKYKNICIISFHVCLYRLVFRADGCSGDFII